MMKRKDIVDLYLELGDFKQAVRESGLPVHIAHIRLLRSGALKVQDKVKYGSESAKLGGEAEELFQKYVPDAVDANKYFKKNHPVYDFRFDNLTIDVKYSSYRTNKASHYWMCRSKGEQDFVCIFLEREIDKKLEDPYVLLIPHTFIDQDYIHISKSGSWFRDFKVEPEEIQPLLRDYSELREAGEF